jgi:hypothetical protein
MGMRYSKQHQVSTAPVPKFFLSNYSITFLAERVENLAGEITHVRLLMVDLLKQNAELNWTC